MNGVSPLAVEKILLIQLRQLGDILLTTPCIRAIRKQRPKAEIGILTHSMGRLILNESPYVDRHFTYSESASKGEEWALAKEIRRSGYDMTIDFMNNPRSAFYTLMSGARKRVAFKSARWPAYNIHAPRPSSGAYIVDEKFDLLEKAGLARADLLLDLPWFESHTQPLMEFWDRHLDFAEAPLRVALSVTHRRQLRRWPISSYAALAERLVKKWGAAVVWIWGPGEEDIVDAAFAATAVPTLKAPATTFRELAAFMANCDLFIGNSNGPSHVAVAGRICSLQLHGPTRAKSWCPFTSEHQALQSPDGLMEAISLEDVEAKLGAMKQVLDGFVLKRRQDGLRLNWQAP